MVAFGTPHATADALDWPTRVDTDASGVANVAMRTDYVGGFVTRIDRFGLLVDRWANDGPAEDIAVGSERRVYTVQYRSNRLYGYRPDGVREVLLEMDGNVRAVAVALSREAISTTVYVLDQRQPIGALPLGPPTVSRFTLDGAQHAAWTVPDAARDLYAGVALGESGPGVTVAAGGILTRHGPNGSVVMSTTLPGDTVGLSGDAVGRLYTVLPAGPVANGQLWRVDTDGRAEPQCDLPPGRVSDLAIDRVAGEVLVIIDFDLWRLGLDCRPVKRYDREALNGFPTPTGAPTVRPRSTPTPSPTSAATRHTPATGTPTTPTTPVRPTPTMTDRVSPPPIYVPRAWR